MPEPYIRKLPNELIRAADWNQIQIEARRQIEELHDHTGGTQGSQLGTGALSDGAITTDKLSDGSVTMAKLAGDISLTPPDGSITTAKLADGSVTMAKLAGDISLTPPDGSITTPKLGPGAVTSDKLGPGAVTSDKLAAALSLPELAVNGRPVRPSFDHASFEWSWTYTQATGEIWSDYYDWDGLGALFTHAQGLARGAQYPAFLRALRLITDHIETDWIRELGIEEAFARGLDSRLERALTSHGMTQQDRDDALSTIDMAYQQAYYVGHLIGVARLGDIVAMDRVRSAGNPTQLLAALQQHYANDPARAVAARNEILGTIVQFPYLPRPDSYDGPDGLVLPEAPEERAVMEVEMEVELSATRPTVIGIGSGYTGLQPGQFYVVPPGTHTISMRRRMPLLRIGLLRTAWLCGQLDTSGGGTVEPTRILDLRITARTYPGADTLESNMSLGPRKERPLPEKRSASPRRTTGTATTSPTKPTTDPSETPPIIPRPEES